MVPLFASIFLVLAGSQASEKLHPAFVKDEKTLQTAWDKGLKDAEKKRDSTGALKPFMKGIGSIRTAPLSSETVSWLSFVPPEVLCYAASFKAKKQYASPEEVGKIHDSLVPKSGLSLAAISVSGTITLMPSFGRYGGRISRHADPADLKDVRVVLKVGDKVYQPREQPGNLLQASGTANSTFAVPNHEVIRTKGTVSISGSDSRGTRYSGYGNGSATATRDYITCHEQSYDWYQGRFTATFDLFDEDGAARIRPSEKEITFIVIYGANERKAVYKLEELLNVKL